MGAGSQDEQAFNKDVRASAGAGTGNVSDGGGARHESRDKCKKKIRGEAPFKVSLSLSLSI